MKGVSECAAVEVENNVCIVLLLLIGPIGVTVVSFQSLTKHRTNPTSPLRRYLCSREVRLVAARRKDDPRYTVRFLDFKILIAEDVGPYELARCIL